MGKSKKLIIQISLLLSAALLFISGCGSREVSQGSEPEPSEIDIFYHADDGEFHRMGLGWEDVPAEESDSEEGSDSAEESGSEKESAAEDEDKTVITLVAALGANGNEVDQDY